MTHPQKISIISLGLNPANNELPPAYLARIQKADVLVGGTRLLDRFPEFSGIKIPITSPIAEGIHSIQTARDAGQNIVVLADGDALLFGIGNTLAKHFPSEQLRVLSHVSAVQAAASRLALPWREFKVVSLHGRTDYVPLYAGLTHNKLVAVYTDNTNTPAVIAQTLMEQGVRGFTCHVFARLDHEDETHTTGTLKQLAESTFSTPNILVLERNKFPKVRLRLGIPDQEFSFERGLITKTPVRAAGIAALDLEPHHTLWDLGAGCGSVSIEAAALLREGQVRAVEKDRKRYAMIQENIRRTGTYLVRPVLGSMPEALENLPAPDRIFLGGGAPTPGVLEQACARLRPGGIFVAHLILLGSFEEVRKHFSKLAWPTQITQITCGQSEPLAGDVRLAGMNPVFIVRAQKPEV